MNLFAGAGAAARHLVLAAALGVVVLVVLLAAFGFLAAAALLWLMEHLSAWAAASITGGALLVVAFLIGAIGAASLKRAAKSRPPMLPNFGGMFVLGVRLIGLVVRRDPKKALMMAVLSGAMLEYFMSENKK